jgi:3-hydroxybutyryl-CoA dehydrogenase
MGSGIAQIAALAGLEVTLHDLQEERVEQGFRNIEFQLTRMVDKGRLEPDGKKQALSRIRPASGLTEAIGADVVIEAIVEQLEAKRKLVRELDVSCPKHTILATNTSSLPITEIAAATGRPDKVIGMHFMNPVPVMKLVEVIRGVETSEETYHIIHGLAERLGKSPVPVNDSPGFAINRILLPMINEAIYAVYEGVAAPEVIDQVMTVGANQPLGPLALADMIGLDTCLSIMEVLQREFGDDKYRPCPLLRLYVRAGRLGRKAGKGFYDYAGGGGSGHAG